MIFRRTHWNTISKPKHFRMCPNLPNSKDNFYIQKGSKRCAGELRLGADKDGKCTVKHRALEREAELQDGHSLLPGTPSLCGGIPDSTNLDLDMLHPQANSKETAPKKPLAVSKTHPKIFSPIFETIPSTLGRNFVTQPRFYMQL